MANAVVIPDWQTAEDAKSALPDYKRREVETLQAQAVAYVWGFQDASGKGAKDTGWSVDFGRTYAMHAAWFEAEQLCYRRSIPDAFSRVRRGLAIED